MSKAAFSVATLLALGFTQGADAMTLYSTSSSTCASVAVEDLRFSLSSSVACMTDGDSNPKANAINALDPTASDWAELERDTSAANATSGLLTTDASFGLLQSNKHWTLQSSFWDTYGFGLIAVRAQGRGDSKEWVGFVLNAGSTSGTFSVTGRSGSRLSSMVLFGHGTAVVKAPAPAPAGLSTSVPEPGSLALLGIGLLGLGLRRGQTGT